MSKFYGKMWDRVEKQSTRCGHKQIVTQAASFAGAIEVRLYEDENGVECFAVRMIKWIGAGDSALLCEGEIGKASSVTHYMASRAQSALRYGKVAE